MNVKQIRISAWIAGILCAWSLNAVAVQPQGVGRSSVATSDVVSTSSQDSSQHVMFDYQGFVRVQGVPYDGSGLFKFAIVNTSGNTTLWSIDGTSAGGSEPSASVSASVTNGFFDVMVGDPSLGMEPINRVIFNRPGKVKLRIWFSDGSHGFERLLPDRMIVNPELFGIVSGTEDFTIYVNGTAGDDENDGLTTDTAKKTIQAAVDALPSRIRANITVAIAAGVYREQVTVYGFVVEPGKTFLIQGDKTWTPSMGGSPNVRITGTDDDLTHTPSRLSGVYFQQCSGSLDIRGIRVDYCSASGFEVTHATAWLENCYSVYNDIGLGIPRAGFAFATNFVAEHNVHWGIIANRNAFLDATDCVASYNGTYGVTIDENAGGNFHGTCDFSNNALSGMSLAHQAYAIFWDGYVGTINNNGDYGIDIRYNSYTENHTLNTFSGNTNGDVHTQWGGQTYF